MRKEASSFRNFGCADSAFANRTIQDAKDRLIAREVDRNLWAVRKRLLHHPAADDRLRPAGSPVALAAWMLDHDTDSYYKISDAFVDGEPVGNLTRDHNGIRNRLPPLWTILRRRGRELSDGTTTAYDAPALTSVRRYARWALILLTGLFLLAVIVQILTAGFAIFGATSFDLHEDLGFSLTHGLSILVFLAALIAWIEPSGLALAFLIGALTTVQVFLPEIDNRWIAGLHPVNALLIFLLALLLLWRVRPIPPSRPVSPSA